MTFRLKAAVVVVLGTALAGCSAGIDAVAVNKAIDTKFARPDTDLPLWGIQPGLGTVMIEYNARFANAWFAAEAGNWDMVKYQLKEMREIQAVAETTRPARAESLKAFEVANIDPLAAAADAKDATAFKAQYARTLSACNTCHQQQGFGYIQIVAPTEPATKNVDWKAP